MAPSEGGLALPVEPGLCGTCRHAAVKGTNRGTVYLRCARAAWDDRLVRYPRLPVTGCVGFEPGAGTGGGNGGKGRNGGEETASGGVTVAVDERDRS